MQVSFDVCDSLGMKDLFFGEGEDLRSEEV